MNDLLARRRSVLGTGLRLYYDFPFEPVSGKGVFLYDAQGRAYLDAYNNVPHVGYGHPHVVDAITRQTAALNTNTRYLFESVVDYAERLVRTTGGDLDAVMFTCTGSEANDLAWRIATTVTGNAGAITTNRAYHGNTVFLRSIDASVGVPRDGAPWAIVGPATPRFYAEDPLRTPADYGEDMAAAIERLERGGHRPAAFLFDTYFCSEGVHTPTPGFVDDAVARLRAAGGLVIADEVQVGLGRNGETFWGYQKHGFAPDIVTCGKPMGNGQPIGAVIARRDLVERFFATDRYFNTYAGNPVSSAAGIAVLEALAAENLQANAGAVGRKLNEGLRALQQRHECLGAIRGEGFLQGVEIVKDRATREPDGARSRTVINELCRRGVLVGLTGPNRAARNILKVRPPLVFGEAHLDQLLQTLDEVLGITTN